MNAPRVTQITVKRLYNLGEYEHASYELQISVPEGADVGRLITRVDSILKDLRPSKIDQIDVLAAEQTIARTTAEIPEYSRQQAMALIERARREDARRSHALTMLQSLGGGET